MKLISFAIFFSSLAFNAFAQKASKTDSMILKKVLNEDFSNTKYNNTYHKTSIPFESAEMDKTSIVILNSKNIYHLSSKQIRDLNKEDIIDVSILKNIDSTNNIKNFILITTRKN